ncbi:MAG: hypothetical protein ABI857_12215 [Acidobacteriota bacterium]
MPNENERPQEPGNSKSQKKPFWKPIIWTAITTLSGFVIIWFFCLRYIPLEKERVVAFINAALTFAIFMGMLLQIFIARLQWDSMQETLNEYRKSVERNDRPILVVIAVTGNIKSDGIENPRFVVTNKGNSPAQKVRLSYGACRFGDDMWDSETYPQENFGVPFVFRGVELAFRDTNGAPIRKIIAKPQNSVEKFIVKHSAVYVFGDGTYTDMVGKEYRLDRWAYCFDEDVGAFQPSYTVETSEIMAREWIEQIHAKNRHDDKAN